MPQEFEPIPELQAAHFIDALLKSYPGADRLAIVDALLAWIAILLQDADSKTRIGAAYSLVARAVWLAPGERFDAETFRILDGARAEIVSTRAINNNTVNA